MLELTVDRTPADVLRECERRGLIVKMDGFLRTKRARHWHLGFPKQPGVLEITDLGDRSLLQVAANRDGGWASAMARDIAKKNRKRS